MFVKLQNVGRPAPRRIAGVTLMLAGLALIGSGAHYLTENGTCAGHVSFGPAHPCSSGQSLYLLSVFLLAPALAVSGWALARLGRALWPALCAAVGVGLVTVGASQSAVASAKAFGLVAGTCFLALAAASLLLAARKRVAPVRPALAGPAAILTGPGTTLAVRIAAPYAPDPRALRPIPGSEPDHFLLTSRGAGHV